MDITALLNPGAEAQPDPGEVRADIVIDSSEASVDLFLSELVGANDLLMNLPADGEAAPIPLGLVENEAEQGTEKIAEVLERWSGISAAIATDDPSHALPETETTTIQEGDYDAEPRSSTQIPTDEVQKNPPFAKPLEHMATVQTNPAFNPEYARIERIPHPQATEAEIDLSPLPDPDVGLVHSRRQSPQPAEPPAAPQAKISDIIRGDAIAETSSPGQNEIMPRKTGIQQTMPPITPTQTETQPGQQSTAAVPQPVMQSTFEQNGISLPVRPHLEVGGFTDIQPSTNFRPAMAHPPAIARQIADIVITTRNEMVEITLIPEELGRIRMILTGQERAPHLTVWVERPEVLDQMRRQSNDLLQEFHKEGMADATLDFRDGRQLLSEDGKDSSAWNDPDGVGETIPSTVTSGPMSGTYRMRASLSGIDIRV